MTEEQKKFGRDFYDGARRPTAVFDKGRVGRNEPRGENENARARGAQRGNRKMREVRREAGERRRKVKRRRALLLTVAFIVIFALIAGVVYKLMFVVKNINVTGSEVYSTEEICDAGGLSQGVNLYSFRASSFASSVTLKCPYISRVTLEREIPDTVNISATEESAVYYADIYGEYKLLSESLRVLGTVAEDEISDELIMLKLPSVSYAVAGRQISFAVERRRSDVTKLLTDVAQSELCDRISMIDLRDKYEVTMVCDGLRLLVIGENEDVEYKLRVASKVLEDAMFANNTDKYRIDLTVRGKTGVLKDNSLVLE